MTKRLPVPTDPDRPPMPIDRSVDPDERIRRLLELPSPAPRWVDPTRKDHVKPREK